jgi:hypothetical protein
MSLYDLQPLLNSSIFRQKFKTYLFHKYLYYTFYQISNLSRPGILFTIFLSFEEHSPAERKFGSWCVLNMHQRTRNMCHNIGRCVFGFRDFGSRPPLILDSFLRFDKFQNCQECCIFGCNAAWLL